MSKPRLTAENLIEAAKEFCQIEKSNMHKELYGVTDGKAIGTYIERRFKNFVAGKYEVELGNAARGIDFPSPSVRTDIKVTSIRQPQSSSPFRSPRQKIYGLGYHLLVFVYDKMDDHRNRNSHLDFKTCFFIKDERTGDYTITYRLRQMIKDGANVEDIAAYLRDRHIPGDDWVHLRLAEEILQNPPKQGYLTVSNALQWRLQYSRVINLDEKIEGIVKF